jgi:hypothetical protein
MIYVISMSGLQFYKYKHVNCCYVAKHMAFGQSHAASNMAIPFSRERKHAKTDGTPSQVIIVGAMSTLSN